MIGYLRVSKDSDDEEAAGIAAQRTTIEAAVQVDRYETDVLSGKTTDRPGLQAALADCAAGKADGIVVAKLDRLSRSMADFANLLERAKREHWNIVALDFGLDISTPQGELVANVLMAVAQWERRMIGERTREALAEKRAQGVRLGAAPKFDAYTVAEARAMLQAGHTVPAVMLATGMGRSSVYQLRKTG